MNIAIKMNVHGNCRSTFPLNFLIVLLFQQCYGAEIIIITFQQPSHVITKLGIGADLVGRGHDVYYALASEYPKVDAVRQAGIGIIHYQQAADIVYPFTPEAEEQLAEYIYSRQGSELDSLWPSVEGDCTALMKDKAFLSQLKSLKFDLAIVEPFIVNPCHIIVPYYLGIPYVSISAGVSPSTSRLPALPSFFSMTKPGPEVVNVPQFDTLFERFKSTLMFIGFNTFFLPMLWGNTTLLKEYAPEVQSWEELMLRSEMVMIENDHHLNPAMPLLPHAVNIAGCTARPYEGLPDTLEKLMTQSAEHGVILASFGTSAYRMPPHISAKFLEAFGRLEETVLTKMAVSESSKVPANVHMQSWFPQNDILGHPNTKLFITHCGSNSQYEALYHGVPMLGIPMFAEQGWNCGRARHKGLALCLDLLEFTADELYVHIRELIDNGTYRANIRKLSQISRDQPMTCTEKAGFWIDHVIKYGSEHLRSPALNQSLYEFLMLDIIVVILLIILVFVIISYFCTSLLLRRIKRTLSKKKND